MICIELEYRRWWCPWKSRMRSYAPSSWWEMDERQFLTVVSASLGKITREQYYSRMFGLRQRHIHHLDDWQTYVLGKVLKFLDEGRAESSRIYIQSIEGLHCPDNALQGMSLQQFMTVDTLYIRYTDTITDTNPMGAVHLLCQMVAALYMRRNEHYFADNPGEKVVDLTGNALMLEHRADRTMLWGVFLNWVMLRNWLCKTYPLLFPEADEEAGKRRMRVKNAWLTAFDNFIGDDIAHIDNYRRMCALDAFRLMNKRIKRNLTKK